jgi:hypothetical protein
MSVTETAAYAGTKSSPTLTRAPLEDWFRDLAQKA